MVIAELLSKAEDLFQSVSSPLNQIVIALVIVLAGFIIGKILENILRKVLANNNIDDRLTKLFKARRNYARAIRRTTARIIYVATVIIALQTLQAFNTVLTLFLFLAVVIVLISLALAGLEVIPNLYARAALRKRGVIVGDELVVADKTGVIAGTVVDMTFTDVRIRRRNGDLFFIPNAVLLHERIIKKGKQDKGK